MRDTKTHTDRRGPAEVVDFDEALLRACPPQARADLMMEAELLAGVFAPGGDPERIQRIAAQLSSGARDEEMDRPHARKLAAALKHLTRAA